MAASNARLGREDQRYLDAAEGWLGLGSWSDANEELEHVSPRMKAHPEVLRVRYGIYALAKKWEEAAQIAHAIAQLAPNSVFGHLHHAFALHEMGRTREAWDVLRPAAKRFPREYIIQYNLACYACRLGNLAESLRLLKKAIDLSGRTDIRQMALDDPDLEALWGKIGEI
jgi:predicted Zn-dependent protease